MIANIVAEKSDRIYPLGVKGIGAVIQVLRNARGWSQSKLAKCSKINIETVNRIEHDQNTTIKKLEKIAGALGVKFGELLPEDQLPNGKSIAIAAFRPFARENEHYHQTLEELLASNQAKAIIEYLDFLKFKTATDKERDQG
jgi:transcriptional regulator with XRE-family HTH domain